MSHTAYGLQCNDSMTRYPVKDKKGQETMFEEDVHGNLFVKKEFARCEICGCSLEDETIYVRGTRQLCKTCEKKSRMQDRKQSFKKKEVKK